MVLTKFQGSLVFLLWLCFAAFIVWRLISGGKSMIERGKDEEYGFVGSHQTFVGHFMVVGGFLAILMVVCAICSFAASLGR